MENGRHIGQDMTNAQPEGRQNGLAQSGVIKETPIAAHTPHLEASTRAMEQILTAINNEPGLLDNALASGALTGRSK